MPEANRDQDQNRGSGEPRESRVSFLPAGSGDLDDARWRLKITRLRKEYVSAARAATQAEAARLEALAALQAAEMERCSSDAELDHALRARAAECAAELRVNDSRLLGEMTDAHRLVHDFPETFSALRSARLSVQHARTIVREAGAVDGRRYSEYEARCLEVATQTTPGRLRAAARRIAEDYHVLTPDERHRLAASERRVWVRDLPDGMAELGAVLPAVLAYGIKDRLTRAARAVRKSIEATTNEPTANEPATALPPSFAATADQPRAIDSARARRFARARVERSLDVLRADLLADLLLTGPRNPITSDSSSESFLGITANIQLIVPADGSAARLDGYGPIDAETARQFTAVAPGWDRIALDADGSLLATDRRQPTESMRRILEARDTHCRFPGCWVPVSSCEIDHTEEWARGGLTEISNLGHLCPRHHRLKHPDLPEETRWRAKQDRRGVYTWTSPTGKTYSDEPEHPYDTARAGAPSRSTEHPLAA